MFHFHSFFHSSTVAILHFLSQFRIVVGVCAFACARVCVHVFNHLHLHRKQLSHTLKCHCLKLEAMSCMLMAQQTSWLQLHFTVYSFGRRFYPKRLTSRLAPSVGRHIGRLFVGYLPKCSHGTKKFWKSATAGLLWVLRHSTQCKPSFKLNKRTALSHNRSQYIAQRWMVANLCECDSLWSTVIGSSEKPTIFKWSSFYTTTNLT